MELLELLELLTEGAAEGLDRSLAILSLRSPTFSVSGSVQDKSAENMLDAGRKEKVHGAPNELNYESGGGGQRATE